MLKVIRLLFVLSLGMMSTLAHAYVGPGLGVGTIAILLGIVLVVLLALFALVWYPIKRRLKSKKQKEQE